LSSGEMSENDYKEFLKKLVVLDELNLKIFTQLKLTGPTNFV